MNPRQIQDEPIETYYLKLNINLVTNTYLYLQLFREVRIMKDLRGEIEGRDVLVVEDIIDSGTTIERLAAALGARGPASLELCALMHKHLATDLSIEPRWVGFDAPPDFLVGYGLDHAEDYRHLPFVASLDG